MNNFEKLTARAKAQDIVTNYELARANNQRPIPSGAEYTAALLVLKHVGQPRGTTSANFNQPEG